MGRMRAIDWLYVTGLLLAAFALRTIGNDFGLPDARYSPSRAAVGLLHQQTPLHPDEFLFTSHALQMVLSGDLTPGFYENPSSLINLNFITFTLTNSGAGLSHDERQAQMTNFREYSPFPLYTIGRVYSALGGVLAVAAVYAVTRLLANRRAAAAAGLLCAVCFPLVQHGHYATTSSLAAGFSALTIWAAVLTMRRGSVRWLTVAAVAAGLAAGTRYNAAVVSLVVLLSGLHLMHGRWQANRDLRSFVPIVAAWLVFPLTFLLTSPAILFDVEKLIADLHWISNQYFGEGLVNPWLGLVYELHYLVIFGVGIPAAVLFFAGGFVAVRRAQHRRTTLIVLAFIVVYIVLILRTVRPTGADQLLLPVLPALTIFAGIGTAALVKRFKMSVVRAGIMVATAALPLAFSVLFVARLDLTDNRIVMLRWIYDNVSTTSRIMLVGAYNVPLDPADYDYDHRFTNLAQVPADDLAQFDYLLVSDAVTLKESVSPVPAFPRGQNDFVLQYGDDPRFEDARIFAQIARPQIFGTDFPLHTATYWHNPTLTLYCLNEAACAAPSIE